MINEEDIGLEFTVDNKKLETETTLAEMHIWLENEKNMKVVKMLWEKARPDSKMTEFLRSPEATARGVVYVVSNLVHDNFLSEFYAIRCLMLMSEEGIDDILSGKINWP